LRPSATPSWPGNTALPGRRSKARELDRP
jgi:hypothetical protein